MEGELEGRIFAEFRDDYAILWMKNGENRFNKATMKRLHEVLDEIKRNTEVKFLITTGEQKFYSNGLDLKQLGTESSSNLQTFSLSFYSFLSKLLTFPVPTFAALNGHAFAGGLFLALAHDYRVMRTKRGWICLPEIKLRMRFPIGLRSLLRAKLPSPRVATNAIIMGKRFTAEEALAAGLVDNICCVENLLSTTIEYGRSIVGTEDYDRESMEQLKSDLYDEVVQDLQTRSFSREPKNEREQAKL